MTRRGSGARGINSRIGSDGQLTYKLGERDPSTLPGKYTDSESVHLNWEKSRVWRTLGRKVRANEFIGMKYI